MNNNKFWRAIGYFILLLGILFLLFGVKLLNYFSITPISFFVIAILFCIIGGVILWLTNSEQDRIRRDRNRTKHLIENGVKIEIPLNKCEVKTNQYFEEIEKEITSQGNLILHLVDEAIDIPKLSAEQSVIIYRTEIKGESVSFHSEALFYNGKDLEKFIQHNYKVDVYYNPNDISDYFFDMQFYS